MDLVVWVYNVYIDGLVQERRASTANALELRLSCTNPSICYWSILVDFTNIIQVLLDGNGTSANDKTLKNLGE